MELLELVASLEKQIATQRSDLINAASNLESAAVYRTSLEDKIEILNQTVTDQTDQARIPSLQERFEEMEMIVVELARRAESAETSLSLLIDLGTKQHEVQDGRIIPSESAQSHPFSAAPIFQIGELNSDSDGFPESQRYSDISSRSKAEFRVFPPVGPMGITSVSSDENVTSSDFHLSITSRQEYADNPSMVRHEEEYFDSHEIVGHSTVTGTDNKGVMKKSSGARKSLKAFSKSSSTIITEKPCPHSMKSREIKSNASRSTIDFTPTTVSRSRNVSLGSEYGSYIREVQRTLPNYPVMKCTPSILREKSNFTGLKSQSARGYQSSSSSKVRDSPQGQNNSGAAKNLTRTRNPSTLYYDLSRGEGAPTINSATFHQRQASPYRPRNVASSIKVENYTSTPSMKLSTRGATTTPTVIKRAGRHKLQVRNILEVPKRFLHSV